MPSLMYDSLMPYIQCSRMKEQYRIWSVPVHAMYIECICRANDESWLSSRFHWMGLAYMSTVKKILDFRECIWRINKKLDPRPCLRYTITHTYFIHTMLGDNLLRTSVQEFNKHQIWQVWPFFHFNFSPWLNKMTALPMCCDDWLCWSSTQQCWLTCMQLSSFRQN